MPLGAASAVTASDGAALLAPELAAREPRLRPLPCGVSISCPARGLAGWVLGVCRALPVFCLQMSLSSSSGVPGAGLHVPRQRGWRRGLLLEPFPLRTHAHLVTNAINLLERGGGKASCKEPNACHLFLIGKTGLIYLLINRHVCDYAFCCRYALKRWFPWGEGRGVGGSRASVWGIGSWTESEKFGGERPLGVSPRSGLPPGRRDGGKSRPSSCHLTTDAGNQGAGTDMPLSRAPLRRSAHLVERFTFLCALEKGWFAHGLMLGAEEGLKRPRKRSCPLESSWEAAARSARARGDCGH